MVQAAEEVLTRMHFAIEKLDAEQGIVRTRPLRGANSSSSGAATMRVSYDWEEANLQSVRRSVELRVEDAPEDGGRTPPGCASSARSRSSG